MTEPVSTAARESQALAAARDTTEAQLRMALDIIQKAVPEQQARLSDTSLAALAAGVIQAFATNFAAITISRAASGAGDPAAPAASDTAI